jgi:hypothetical protein
LIPAHTDRGDALRGDLERLGALAESDYARTTGSERSINA